MSTSVSVCLFVCVSVCLCVCASMSICLCVCASVHLCAFVPVHLCTVQIISDGKSTQKITLKDLDIEYEVQLVLNHLYRREIPRDFITRTSSEKGAMNAIFIGFNLYIGQAICHWTAQYDK